LPQSLSLYSEEAESETDFSRVGCLFRARSVYDQTKDSIASSGGSSNELYVGELRGDRLDTSAVALCREDPQSSSAPIRILGRCQRPRSVTS